MHDNYICSCYNYPQYEKYHTTYFVTAVIKPEQLQVGKQLYLQQCTYYSDWFVKGVSDIWSEIIQLLVLVSFTEIGKLWYSEKILFQTQLKQFLLHFNKKNLRY